MVMYLAQVHDNALVDLLPEMSSEDLDERDLECGDLPVHEDASQVQLNLEPHVHLERGRRSHRYVQAVGAAGLTLALLMVGDHHKVKRRLGIWFSPDLWALVSFLYFMDSSKPLAFSQNRPSQVGK